MLKKFAKTILLQLSLDNQRAFLNFLSKIPLLNKIKDLSHRRWVRETYTPFGRGQRNEVFLSIARFAHINRPITGYYMEFGCHEGNTMRLAWNNFQYLFDWDYIAFDSFEGLPDMENFDRSDIFFSGNLSTNVEHFKNIMLKHGMPASKLRTVKGFYDQTLTPELQQELLPKKAAVVYVDCDLYKSTIPVLDFMKPFLQLGTVVYFDDWNCYHAQPDHGERRAWQEFLEAHPEYGFEAFVQTAEGKGFICTKLPAE